MALYHRRALLRGLRRVGAGSRRNARQKARGNFRNSFKDKAHDQ